MMYLINLFEGLIAVWSISELCDIENKKIFIFLTTLFTFIASYICDLYHWNSWPLLIAYVVIWFIMSSLYAKKSYMYNFFVSLVCNYIINMSLVFPLLFLYKYDIMLASIMTRIIQFVISYLFILYRRRYKYIENKYWIPVMLSLICCMFILEDKIYSYFDGPMSASSLVIIFLTFVIACISLMFFSIIEKFVYEKTVMYKQLERERYRNLSYDIINYSKRELDYLHHELIYRLMLIKSKLDSNECEDASKILGTYINDINKYSHIMTTGNEVFDVFFTINTSNVKFELVKNISIPKKEFYNSIEFINFISGLLNHIQEDNVVHFAMEDKGYLCSISLSSTECFYVKKKLEEFMDKNKNNYISYDLSEDPYFYLLKIVMRIKDEKDLQVFNEYIKFK